MSKKQKSSQCIAPGCTRDRKGTKFCAECAEASKQISLAAGKARYQLKLKANRLAKRKKREAAPVTKLCPVCQKAQIPLKRHYCDTCRDATNKQRKRDSQRKCRQQDKTGPVHYGFSKQQTAALSDAERDRINVAKHMEDQAQEKRLSKVREGLNHELLLLRVLRGATVNLGSINCH